MASDAPRGPGQVYAAVTVGSGSVWPQLALAGLNPHAGEGGLLGNEEQEVFAPDVDPVPADVVFRRGAEDEFDAVIACYHDQGLLPIKLMAFGRAVNVTQGLLIVRTSVDHGTGFDIAGKGVADPAAMIAAVRLAVLPVAPEPELPEPEQFERDRPA